MYVGKGSLSQIITLDLGNDMKKFLKGKEKKLKSLERASKLELLV